MATALNSSLGTFPSEPSKWLETELLGWKFARRLPGTGGSSNGRKWFTCELEKYPPRNQEKVAASEHRGLNLHRTGYGAPHSRAPTDRAHQLQASGGCSTGGDALRDPAGPTAVTVPAAEAARMGSGPGQPLTHSATRGDTRRLGCPQEHCSQWLPASVRSPPRPDKP